MTASPLVPVVPGIIGNVQCLTVDGRTLHGVLGVRRDFSNWIKGRISKYGFVQGHDFEVFAKTGENSEGGRPSQEYTCTLDMGKELCMVENNEKGRIARRYFIECERRLLSSEPVGNPDRLPSPLSKRTDPERKQLTAIINTWVGMAPIHYAAARAQVNAHFGVTGVDCLTVAQVKEAIQWVQAKIDELPKALPAPERLPMYRNGAFYPPRINKSHIPGPSEAALMALWKDWPRREKVISDAFNALMDDIRKYQGDSFPYLVSDMGRNADTMFGVDCLLEGLYCAQTSAISNFKRALELARLHLRLVTNVAVVQGR